MRNNFYKKALMPLLVLSFLSTIINAQVYSNKESSIMSFTVGLTSSNLINDSISFRSGILFNGGLTYSVMLGDKVNAEVEVLYSGKAIKNDSPIIKYRYYYVDIPVFAQIKLGENIRINVGGQYSIATNSTITTIDPKNANGVHTSKIVALKPTDYGFLAGAEIDLSKNISIGARYTISGSTFFEKNAINFGVFQLSVKYSPIKTYQVFFHKKEVKSE